MNLLLAFIPISLLLEWVFKAPPLWIFATAVIAIIPLADLLRQGTEQIAARAGQAIGGLLNVTFGNLAELIIAVFVLLGGNTVVVKAQITGSIIGNALLGLGLAILIGSFGRDRQKFNRENAGQLNSMLFLVVIALLIPALFDYTERLPDFLAGSTQVRGNLDEYLSLGVAVVLITVYALNLVYTLVTHKDVFALEGEEEGHGGASLWPVWKAAAVMVGPPCSSPWNPRCSPARWRPPARNWASVRSSWGSSCWRWWAISPSTWQAATSPARASWGWRSTSLWGHHPGGAVHRAGAGDHLLPDRQTDESGLFTVRWNWPPSWRWP